MALGAQDGTRFAMPPPSGVPLPYYTPAPMFPGWSANRGAAQADNPLECIHLTSSTSDNIHYVQYM